MKNPTGIMFGSGPNGSGQTTTLDAAINAIRSRRINIPTIEDPVEIPGPGVMLRRINPRIDLNSATMLRAFLRQDADEIMVGEIRDTETAKIATEAALTGHLVFATLRTTTTPQAIVRLMEIGVEAYVVAPRSPACFPLFSPRASAKSARKPLARRARCCCGISPRKGSPKPRFSAAAVALTVARPATAVTWPLTNSSSSPSKSAS